MKRHLADTTDIVRDPVTAPASKRAMLRRERELAGADAALALPSMTGLAPELLALFTRNLRVAAPEAAAPEEERAEAPDTGAADFSLGAEPSDFQPEAPLAGEGEVEPEAEREEEVEMPLPSAETEQTVLNDKALKMLHFLNHQFTREKTETLSYNSMVSGKKTKTVAGTFYQLLVLKTLNYIDVKQPAPFGDIAITPTVSCFSPCLMYLNLLYSLIDSLQRGTRCSSSARGDPRVNPRTQANNEKIVIVRLLTPPSSNISAFQKCDRM
jgi:hypothetical protein